MERMTDDAAKKRRELEHELTLTMTAQVSYMKSTTDWLISSHPHPPSPFCPFYLKPCFKIYLHFTKVAHIIRICWYLDDNDDDYNVYSLDKPTYQMLLWYTSKLVFHRTLMFAPLDWIRQDSWRLSQGTQWETRIVTTMGEHHWTDAEEGQRDGPTGCGMPWLLMNHTCHKSNLQLTALKSITQGWTPMWKWHQHLRSFGTDCLQATLLSFVCVSPIHVHS